MGTEPIIKLTWNQTTELGKLILLNVALPVGAYFISHFGSTLYLLSSVGLAVIMFLAFLFFQFKPRSLQRTSPLIDPNGNPVLVPVVSSRYSKWFLLSCLCISIQLGIVYLVLWDKVFPLAKIEAFEGSSIVGRKGSGSFLNQDGVIVKGNNGDDHAFYSASLWIAKAPSISKIRIERVRIMLEPLPDARIQMIYSTLPANVVEPNRYVISLTKNSSEYEAVPLTTDGAILNGIVTLDEKTPFGKLHFDFEGGTGLYKAKISIRVKDATGTWTQELVTANYVYIYNKPPENEKDMDKRDVAKAQKIRTPHVDLVKSPAKYYNSLVEVKGTIDDVYRVRDGGQIYCRFMISVGADKVPVVYIGKESISVSPGAVMRICGKFMQEVEPATLLKVSISDDLLKHIYKPVRNVIRYSPGVKAQYRFE